MKTHTTMTLTGTPISPGLAAGKAFVFHDIFESNPQSYNIDVDQVNQEYARIEHAFEDVLEDLRLSAERIEEDLESNMADIFHAHEEMLRDAAFTNEIRKEIEKKLVNAEYALRRVFGRWERKFTSMENVVFKRRGDDVVDLGRRVLRSLAGVHTHTLEKMPKGSILVAHKLLPSDTTFFSRRATAGIVVECGGPGSHCALLTRQLGIPGVAQVSNLLKRITTGDLLLLDGLRGSVTFAPDKNCQSRFREQIELYYTDRNNAKKNSIEPAVTRDGVTIPVMANIGNRHDAEVATGNGADGVGLFRVELFFLTRRMLPTEEELTRGISRIIDPLKGKPLFIRLLDIGGDKSLPYLHLSPELDPSLGQRGVRLLLEYPELLNVQLRALLRLSKEHDIRITVPMVTLASDMQKVRATLEKIGSELGYKKLPQLGAMIETPASALCADDIGAVSDFLNIGTNDLTQYTMAAGRESPFAYQYFKDDHPAIIKLLQYVGKEGDQTPVGICGELASQNNMVQTLLSTGIRMLSVPPPLIPAIKQSVRNSYAHAN